MAYINTDNGAQRPKPALACVPKTMEFVSGGKTYRCVLDRIDKSDMSPATQSVIDAMHNLLNFEIVEAGNSYPFEAALTRQQFVDYYLSHDPFALIVQSVDGSTDPSTWPLNESVGRITGRKYSFGKSFVGSFYVKPNYPGRSSHVANGGFLVIPAVRGCRIGDFLGLAFLDSAAELGYRSTMFNLVYRHNPASVKLWQRLGFTHSGTVTNAGRVLDGSGKEVYSDALQFTFDLVKHREQRSGVSKL